MKHLSKLAAAALLAALPLSAQAAKDSVTLSMTLEPPGLDPTTGAAAAIAQITLYNIYEGLTRINEDSTVSPMLAESWTVSDDGKVYTFNLRKGVTFHDGSSFDSADVKFTYERNAAEDSKNKRKKYFTNMESIETPDAHTVRVTLKEPRPTFLFNMGESTAVIVGTESAASNATKPVGTGPFKFVKWTKADSVQLEKWAGFRDAGSVKLNKVTFKFINDPAAQTAAILAGDIDIIPNLSAEMLDPFRNHPNLEVLSGTTEGETILATNNKRPALAKLKVRQAIAHAINRQELIDGAMSGEATPIGTHFAPHNPDYVADTINTYPHDLAKAKALLKEAGEEGLSLTLQLPPVGYARNGGQIVAQQLEKAGMKVKIENVEWAQWLDVVYKQRNYDLTIVSHVEPMDIGIYANPNYYYQYDSKELQAIMAKADGTTDSAVRSKHLKEAQRKIAADAVNGFLFQLHKSVVKPKALSGIWANSPMFVNDMRAVSWGN